MAGIKISSLKTKKNGISTGGGLEAENGAWDCSPGRLGKYDRL